MGSRVQARPSELDSVVAPRRLYVSVVVPVLERFMAEASADRQRSLVPKLRLEVWADVGVSAETRVLEVDTDGARLWSSRKSSPRSLHRYEVANV